MLRTRKGAGEAFSAVEVAGSVRVGETFGSTTYIDHSGRSLRELKVTVADSRLQTLTSACHTFA